MDHRTKLVAIALMFAAVGAQALTLGRVRGAALIGRALDVVVPVQLDAQDSAASQCFEAEVFHADTRQDPSRVRVEMGTASTAQGAELRIQSATLVDEPVVVLYVRFGCEQKTTRKYVLLADPVSDVQSPVVPLVPASASASGQSDWLLTAPPDTSAAVIAPSVAAKPSAARTRPLVRPAPVQGPQAARSRVPAPPKVAPVSGQPAPVEEKSQPATNASGKPRLKLDPLSQLSDRVALLESSPVASSTEDVLRDLKRIQALDADVKALLALAARNEANLADMKVRLQKAESERFSSTVVYGLSAMVVLSLLAIVWLLRRQRRAVREGDDWWRQEPAATRMPSLAELEAAAPPGKSKPAAPPPAPAPPSGKPESAPPVQKGFQESVPATEVDVSLMELSESNFDQLMNSGSMMGAVRKPSAATQAPAAPRGIAVSRRSLNSEAVMDIRQQAEFFVSLGKADQAVRILERYIQESESPNPLLYLDLMGIFHALGLKIDFRQAREDFNLLFNGRAPEFALFMVEGRNLDAYPEVLARIGAHWGTARAVEVIESCIFRDPWEAKQTPFDLGAFRDLLMLHEIALDVLQAPAQPVDLLQRDLQPEQALDLDLSEPSGVALREAGAPSEPDDVLGFVPLDAAPPEQEGDTLAQHDPVDLLHFDLSRPGESA